MSIELDLVRAALPNYEVGSEVGRGGWGVVLSGVHRTLGRRAAIKQLPRAFANDPVAPRGIKRLAETLETLDPTLQNLAPVQLQCNYITLWFRNVSSLLSEGDVHGTWQRFIIIATPGGPNNEGGPSSAPANGPNSDNYLHSNPYPNTASPGQPKECEAGNEPYQAGRTVIGNPAGTQQAATEGKP